MTTNPNNYIGVSTTLVGYVATAPRNPAYDKDGSRGVKEVSIAINEGYKKDGEFVQTGTTWYTVQAAGDAAHGISALNKGDKVRVENAKQEVRAYKTKDGEEKLGITLLFGEIIVLESAGGADDSDTPF